MKTKSIPWSAFFCPRISSVLLIFMATFSIMAGTLLAFFRSDGLPKVSQRTLTFEERVSYQRAIEDVYWRHRIWPKENSDPKPSLDAVMSRAQLEEKVRHYLRNSQALADDWQRPITTEQLQAEMDRMARYTRQPEVLQELFEALGNDPFVIAECLARPVLAERLLAHSTVEQVKQQSRTFDQTVAAGASYSLPTISDPSGGCIGDTWTADSLTGAPGARVSHTAVWTGSEMIVWGGQDENFNRLNSGGRYSPATNSWAATNTANAPEGRAYHTAVWTGSAMIVWGGYSFDGNNHYWNNGGRYSPGTDSWTATSTTNAPEGRSGHTAVWTGSEMIVWAGFNGANSVNTGGRYNLSTDSWTATSMTNPPGSRSGHTAVWTESEMIVWGGFNLQIGALDTGGRYNPSTDSWASTSTTNVPLRRSHHTAIWTANEMIVWGGVDNTAINYLNTGGRYNASTDNWEATNTTNAPTPRSDHTAVYSGTEMIVWGGLDNNSRLNSGGRYDPDSDSWVATSTTNAPGGRQTHTAIWTGSEMIVWGGLGDSGDLNTGGRYCAQLGPTPTPTPSSTASPTPTPTPTPCTGRCGPTPRPRPTPHPRP